MANAPPATPSTALLLLHGGASPPPPPQFDYEALSEKSRAASAPPTSQWLIQLVATSAALALIVICRLAYRCWRHRRTRIFLAGLPEASPDGAWLVVAYEWASQPVQSVRMPLDGIVSAQWHRFLSLTHRTEHEA